MIERPYDGCGRCLLGLRAGSFFPFLSLLERRRRIDPYLFPGARAMA
ncbi:hypothetical protein AB0K79_24025 [Streptomyces sp. NPDC053782]